MSSHLSPCNGHSFWESFLDYILTSNTETFEDLLKALCLDHSDLFSHFGHFSTQNTIFISHQLINSNNKNNQR
jgi:hypothetical protein